MKHKKPIVTIAFDAPNQQKNLTGDFGFAATVTKNEEGTYTTQQVMDFNGDGIDLAHLVLPMLLALYERQPEKINHIIAMYFIETGQALEFDKDKMMAFISNNDDEDTQLN